MLKQQGALLSCLMLLPHRQSNIADPDQAPFASGIYHKHSHQQFLRWGITLSGLSIVFNVTTHWSHSPGRIRGILSS